MARKPRKLEKNLTGKSVEVLNSIQNGASVDYQDVLLADTNYAAVIRQIGNILVDNPSLLKEFTNELINRVGKEIYYRQFRRD